ncbi:MAG TPA: phage integrase SAM-like domain-containing protein, partial [Saprospiraceae bacterium]|nr:phage integrase SAM-like domain-containing protein [Saprospiraceae bacterium]
MKQKELGENDFIKYFQKLAYKRYESNYDNWMSAYKYLVAFTNEKLKFADLSEKFCNDFKEYLLNAKSNRSTKVKLAQNSASSYFNKFKAALKLAYKEGLLAFDLNSKIEPIKEAETRKNYLTIEELNSLVKTECQNP